MNEQHDQKEGRAPDAWWATAITVAPIAVIAAGLVYAAAAQAPVWVTALVVLGAAGAATAFTIGTRAGAGRR